MFYFFNKALSIITQSIKNINVYNRSDILISFEYIRKREKIEYMQLVELIATRNMGHKSWNGYVDIGVYVNH